MEILFRSLVVLTALLTCIFWVLPYSGLFSPSLDELLLLQQNGLGAVLPANDYVYWGGFLIWQSITIGLFFYNKIARVCFVVFYAISFVASLFYGMQVLLAHEVFISSLLSLTDGVLLAIIYLTSIGGKFENNS